MHHNLELKIQELVWNHKKSGIHVESFVFEPSTIEEEEMGNLYIIMQAYHEERQSSIAKKFHILASLFRKEFYLRHKENPKDSFENTLRRMNITISEMKKAGEFNRVHLDFFIANIRGLDIQFTRSGNISAMLLRGDQLINMAKKIVRSRENPASKKLFDTIATGTLKENDLLILSTVNLFRRVRMKAVQTLHSSLAFPDFMRHMQEYAKPPKNGNNESQESCALLFVKVAPQFEEQTSGMSRSILKKSDKEDLQLNDEDPEISRSTLKKLIFASLTKYSHLCMKNLWIFVKKTQSRILDTIRNRKKMLPEIEEYVPRAKHAHRHLVVFLRHYIGFILVALVIVAGIYYKFYSVNRSFQTQLVAIQKETLRAFQIAETTQDRQQASDILAKAREKAQTILEYFAVKNNIKEDAEGIIEEALDIENKIYGNRTIESLRPLTDFKHSLFALSPRHIVSDKNTLVAIGSPLSLLYRFPLEKSEGSFSVVAIAPEKNANLITHKTSSEYFLTDNMGDLFLLDVRQSVISQHESIPLLKDSSIVSMDAYGDYLYFLDAKNSKIYKSSSGNKTSSWLKERVDLSSAIGLAVDGRIHILTSSGTIYILKNGKIASTIDLSFPQESFTRLLAQDSGGFVALTASGKIYFFDADWKFNYRLIVPQLSSIDDIYVDSNSSTLYILSQNTLYSSPFSESVN